MTTPAPAVAVTPAAITQTTATASASGGTSAGAAMSSARVDTDGDGYRYRSGEIVAVDIDAAALDHLRELGYQVVSSERLEGAGMTLQVLRGPATGDLAPLRKAAPNATLGLNHLFDPGGVTAVAPIGPEIAPAPRARPGCDCRVGMIDTGVDPRIGASRKARVVQKAFGADASAPQPHGSAVATLLLDGIASPSGSAAPEATLLAADIFTPGGGSGSAAAMASALSWLAANGASVINISVTGPPNPVIARVVDAVAARGVAVVAAAGNDGPAAPPVFPGAYPGVVAVTAVDGQGRPYRYANRGAYVMFAARGVEVPVAGPDGAVRQVTGTSFASPLVAVEIARQMREPAAASPDKAILAVASHAVDLGAPGRDPVFGYGLVGARP